MFNKAAVKPTETDVFDPAEVAVEPPKAAPPRRTTTNWMAFVRAKLAPKVFRLWNYPNFFQIDGSSHTRLIPSSEKIIAEVERAQVASEDLGVDFTFVQLRNGWPGWAKLQEAGVEIKDLTCGVCQKKIPTHPQHLLQHMQRHKDATTGKTVPGGRFLIALGRERGVTEEEAYWEDLPNEFVDDLAINAPVT